MSPDGKRLATFGTAGMIWDLEGDKLLERPMKAREFIISAEFSPDGRYLVTVDTQGRCGSSTPRTAARSGS